MANEKRLIDANELIRFCDNEIDKYEDALNKHERNYAKAMCVVKKIARTFPTVDAVEVVRCKDCKHWGGVTFGYVCSRWSAPMVGFKTCTKPDGFCADGQRRDGE